MVGIERQQMGAQVTRSSGRDQSIANRPADGHGQGNEGER